MRWGIRGKSRGLNNVGINGLFSAIYDLFECSRSHLTPRREEMNP